LSRFYASNGAEVRASAKLQKIVENQLAAGPKKNRKSNLTLLPGLNNFFVSFLEALGATRSIFKLLGVRKVRKKIGKALMTNRSSFELENMGHGYYLVVETWLSNFCHAFSYS